MKIKKPWDFYQLFCVGVSFLEEMSYWQYELSYPKADVAEYKHCKLNL